jgi:hypothetical protein
VKIWVVIFWIMLPYQCFRGTCCYFYPENGDVSVWFSCYNRYVLILKTGLEARSSGEPTDFQRLHHQHSDICMLHLFESFMESAPQLVLQLYIMVSQETWQFWTGECCLLTIVRLLYFAVFSVKGLSILQCSYTESALWTL